MKVVLRLGDCVERMTQLPDGSVEGVVCDPPYGLEFMGKDWDRLQGYTTDVNFKGFVLPRQRRRNVKCPDCGKWIYDHVPRACTCGGVARLQQRTMQNWHIRWLAEVVRVLRPGGVLKAFSGTRTYHRLAAAMEEVGFEQIRMEAWGYGSGFPKSMNVSKAIDAQVRFGRSNSVALTESEKDRPVVGSARRLVSTGRSAALGESTHGVKANMERWLNYEPRDIPVTAPATPEGAAWDGWGTALKPAWEPVLVGVKS